jgi:hypothetical protein
MPEATPIDLDEFPSASARARVMQEIPWPVPALVMIRMTDADLDELDLATGSRHYWRTLNAIVARINASKDPAEEVSEVDVGRDIGHGEETEKQLDAMITRRHRARVKTEGHRPSEEMYEESCRRHAAQRREANRLAWLAYHRGQAARRRAVLESLVDHHEEQARKYRHHHEEDSCSTRKPR